MGLYNILFGTPKKRVTEKEYKKVKADLYTEGLTKKEREKVDEIFKSDFYEKSTLTQPCGLETHEIDARITWMKENKTKHGLSDKEIDGIERAMKKRL